MKIGEKKVCKKGNATFKLERIPFDWKALAVYVVVIMLIILYMNR